MILAERNTDFVGLATLVTAVGGAVAAIIAAMRASKAEKTAGQALAAADGTLTEVKRQNIELKKAVADPSLVAEQESGVRGGASVGIAAGVVTVEPLSPRDRHDDLTG